MLSCFCPSYFCLASESSASWFPAYRVYHADADADGAQDAQDAGDAVYADDADGADGADDADDVDDADNADNGADLRSVNSMAITLHYIGLYITITSMAITFLSIILTLFSNSMLVHSRNCIIF